ncbi:hypothetical protein ACRDU6_11190 [Mycolicibacterium sp. ELW1]|uniref:hypothetical protein n=1 Tax=Mycobacteriaceae TaxID=1762 RepID=UPI00143D2C68|nr:hypothetical protein [Mycobacterium sp. ELW1]
MAKPLPKAGPRVTTGDKPVVASPTAATVEAGLIDVIACPLLSALPVAAINTVKTVRGATDLKMLPSG